MPLRLASALLVVVAFALVAPHPAAGGTAPAAGWLLPVRGAVVARFSYDRATPFARGARRGVDLAAPPGARVGAACAGTVTYAGRVPLGGLGVSIRCGPLVATELGLRVTSVRRGARVGRGTRVGVGRGPVLRLGARRAGDRFAYLDPLELIASTPLGRAPLPLARPRRAPPAAPRVRVPVPPRVRAPAGAPAHAPASARAPAGLPLLAWPAVALLAAGTGVGALVRRRRSDLGAAADDAGARADERAGRLTPGHARSPAASRSARTVVARGRQ